MNHPKETSNPSETKKQEIKKRSEEALALDHTFTSDRVLKPFVQLVKCFLDDAKTIEEYWKMTEIAAYKNVCEEDREQVLEVGILAFRQLISKFKATKIKNPLAYFYGILDRKFIRILHGDLDQMLN